MRKTYTILNYETANTLLDYDVELDQFRNVAGELVSKGDTQVFLLLNGDMLFMNQFPDGSCLLAHTGRGMVVPFKRMASVEAVVAV